MEPPIVPASPTPPLLIEARAFGAPAGTPVELIQTHIGYVYLVGAFAYKLKKPVTYDFLDFSTVEKRKWACDREVVLNRRLCPDLYLGCFPIVEDTRAFRYVDDSRTATPCNTADKDCANDTPATLRIVDWCVKMKRMPLDRLFDRLLDANTVTPADVESIARVLAPFYSAQRKTIPTGGLGDFDAVQFNIDENLREGRSLNPEILPAAQLDLIESRARRFLKKYGNEIRTRAKDGFIVDGHGDLRAENICLPENKTPLLFDCIEFNDRFRIADSAQDIAYFAMELEARGRTDLATAFVKTYRESCDPQLPDRLLNFYLGYRAFIKGKVDAWIASDTGIPADQRAKSKSKARNYFDLSLAYALRGESALLVFCGVSGSGKSTLARALNARLRATHLSTDLVREEIIPKGIPREERYTPESTARVYTELFRRAETSLNAGATVLLDGTFTTRDQRLKTLKLARATHAPAILVWADCPPESAAKHIQERERTGNLHGSEANESISLAQRQRFEAPQKEEGFAHVLHIETGTPDRNAILQNAWNEILNALKISLKGLS